MNLKSIIKPATYIFSLLIVFLLSWLFVDNSGQLKEIFSKENNLQASLIENSQPVIPQNLKPVRDWFVQDINVNALSSICESDGKVLFKENGNKKLSIASLTKLMTALVILENNNDYNLDKVIAISQTAVDQEGLQGFLSAGEMLSVKGLLYTMLIESSNDAAYALAEIKGVEQFVGLMNLKAAELGLIGTSFKDVTGLSFENYSTAEDLVKLTKYLLEKHSLIWEILSQTNYQLLTPEGILHHELINTNELLSKIPNIVGGKTGNTPEAKGCLLLVVKKAESNMIYVILGSEKRFEEMEKLINWVNQAYKW